MLSDSADLDGRGGATFGDEGVHVKGRGCVRGGGAAALQGDGRRSSPRSTERLGVAQVKDADDKAERGTDARGELDRNVGFDAWRQGAATVGEAELRRGA